MRVPRRHRFLTRASTDALFRALPPGARFRFSPPDGADVFGADPVRTLTAAQASDDESPLLAGALRAALPRVPAPHPGGGSHFPGGAVGLATYEAGSVLEGGPPPETAEPAWFGVYDTFAIHDEARHEVEVVSWGLRGDTFDEREALRRAVELEEMLRAAESRVVEPASPGGGRLVAASLDAPGHADRVERIREHIRCGDVYQANLTVRFDVQTSDSPLDLFERLRRDNPAPFAAYLETGARTVVSCSPERLLSVHGRELLTRPIKGTAARDADPAEDRRRAEALLASGKDRAELLMITDLLRNDLGKVCVPGTVRVPHLRELESYPHLHHLVSTVRGTLAPPHDVFDALAAVFPCGSITGAPKRRAMEILRELEPAPRDAYTGTIGWVGFDRSADFSVAIRTGMQIGDVFSFGAGGGIVIDSTPEAEWAELQCKARAFARALDVDLEAVPQEIR